MKSKLPASQRALCLLLAIGADLRPQHRDQIAELQTDLESEGMSVTGITLAGLGMSKAPAAPAKPASKPKAPAAAAEPAK